MRAHGFVPDAITRIEVATFARALGLANATAPKTLQAAQYSLPFTIALAGLRRWRGAHARCGEASLPIPPSSPSPGGWCCTSIPIAKAAFPREAGASHHGRDGMLEPSARVSRSREAEPANPMTRADLMEKLVTVNRGKAARQAARCARALSRR